ncbi:hypothetical protein [Sanyastnella coralliicola]|uniref:hypothetical protein n=1 Tax=Sanyastnella coralliicola TaxID=3069118 RepID=UPI0027BA74AB|nr:hypothetical protein [Longitalea sp. SCSIO 12813]
MNRLICSFTLLLSMTLASSTAFAGGEPFSTNAEVRKEISRAISYPGAIQHSNDVEFVLVSFRIEPCGLISILETNASNEAFEQYVVQKLESMNFEGTNGEVHHMRFTFRSQDI